MALSTGTILAGRYEITAPIATGGMGEVWRARDRVLDRVVAAKVLRSEFTGDPSFVARFRNEARHTAALSHPHIASVYDYGETTEDERFPGQQLAFLVMEFVEGKPLVTILHEQGRLPVDWTLHVLGQAADGLSAAHRAGVVHRDIKPGNLIVRPDGVVKLTDFGIARARDATPLTRTGMVIGTAQYLSPEQAQGMEVTAASDVYSLGVVGYECLTGGRPFEGTSQVAVALAHINRPPPPLPAEIPPAVRLLIERALAKDPAERFADGGDFAEAIRSVAAGGGFAAAPLAPGPGTATPVTRTEVLRDAGDGRTKVMGATGAGTAPGGGAAGPPGGARPLPPLQGPPADDRDRDEGRPAAGPPRRGRWGWLVAALALVGLLAGGTWLLLSGVDWGTTDRGGSPTATSPATVLVNTASFLGEDADEVQADLEDLGLRVEQREASQQQVAALGRAVRENAVVGSDPAGEAVPLGTLVTLFVAPEDYAPDTGGQDGGDDGGQDPAPTPTPAPTTAAPTTTPEDDDDGQGDGQGDGNGGPGDTGQPSPATTAPQPPGLPANPPAAEPTASGPAVDGNASGQPSPSGATEQDLAE